jgi:GNAT superfamily N-acetyltransferase
MRTSAPVITDGSMLMPENWRSLPPGKPRTVGGQLIGNDPSGKTIAVHSVVVAPEFQGGGVGRALVKDYVDYVRGIGAGERLALVAHDYLVGFYESAGFVNLGRSEVRFAGGEWFDLVCFSFPWFG